MPARNFILGVVLSAFTQAAFAQGPPPPGLPPGAVPCGGGWCVGGAAVVIGTTAIQSAPLDAARGAASNPENQRGLGLSRGFGGGPLMNMQIQGDGIALPKGVSESGKEQAGEGKEQNQEKNREPAQAKAKNEGVREAEGKEGGTKEPGQDDRKDRGSAPPRLLDRESVPPKAARGRPEIAAPREEKAQDSVARRIDQGLERNPGATRPMDVKVRERTGSAVAVPRCFGESREGENC